MSWEILSLVVGISAVFLAPFIYIWKGLMERIRRLESKVDNQVTDDEVRRLLQDKLDPIKEDLSNINQQIEKILSYMINKN